MRPDHGGDDHARSCATLQRVAMQNGLACAVASRAAAGGASLDLSFDLQHKHFPVAVLKSRKA